MKEHFQVVFLMKMVPEVSITLVRTSTVSRLILKCLLNLSQCIDTVMTKYPFILGMACFSK